MIDDISLLEIAARGSADDVLDFMHYCVALTSELVRDLSFEFDWHSDNMFFLIIMVFIEFCMLGMLSCNSES